MQTDVTRALSISPNEFRSIIQIRQMKIVMDKKLGQAESERRKLEQQLITARSSSFHGSTISLESNSDDSERSCSPNPGTSSVEIPQNGKYQEKSSSLVSALFQMTV